MEYDVFAMMWRQSEQQDQVVLAETVAQAKLAERLGFKVFWAAEHHFHGHDVPFFGAMSAPALLLAYLAGIVPEIGLGTAVWLPALDNPIRVSEQAAVLDMLSGGRLYMGVGQGSREHMDVFEISIQEKRTRFLESMELLMKTFSEEDVTFAGRSYRIPKAVTTVPRLARDPRELVWVGARDDASLEFAARHRLGMLIGQAEPTAKQKTYADLYRHYCRQVGATPRIALARLIYVAETDEQAFEEAGAAVETYHTWYTTSPIPYYHENVAQGYLVPVNEGPDIDRAEVLRQKAQVSTFLVGSPSTVARELTDTAEAIGVDRLLAMFAVPGLSPAAVEASMTRFMREVVPLVGNPASSSVPIS